MGIQEEVTPERPSYKWCAQCALSPEWCGLHWQCVRLEAQGTLREVSTYSDELSEIEVYDVG